VPFCNKRCYYCGCNVFIPRRQDHVTEYLEALIIEIDKTAELLGKRNKVIQLHFGGGTPTYLGTPQFAQVMDAIEKRFELLDDAEVSIEIDPRVTTPEYLKFLKERNFNRISMGVQDLDDEVQKKIGRIQPYEETKKCIDTCRELGFTNINFDLIYGLPKQTVESFRKTILDTIELHPDRLAVYSFAYLPNLKHNQRRIKPEQLPDPHEKYLLSQVALELFVKNGYHYIGMDHYATSDDEMTVAQREGRLSRNFMGYTIHKAPDLIGLGTSAIGYINKTFVQNSSEFEDYVEASKSGKFSTVRGLALSKDDLIREHTITSIMCNFVLNKKDFEKRFRTDFNEYFADELTELGTFIDDELLTDDHENLQVTKLGRNFVRNIAMVFDAYLKKAHAAKPLTFSRTI
jgi:oxygen-independent coproporphyrinogen-3 oxidase